MATIYDIARLAGVSTATVSHVMNGTRNVNPETAERVQTAMVDTKYRPNILARSLRTKRTKAIGLIVPDIANPFHAALASAVERVCSTSDRTLVVSCSGYSPEREQQHVEAMWQQRVDGLLLAPARTESPGYRLAHDLGLSIVAVDNECLDATYGVTSNNEAVGELAARHLLDLGHRQFACITSHPGWATTNDRRLASFRQTVQAAGGELPDTAIAYTDFAGSGGESAMATLQSRSVEMTAVFACNDLMAAGAVVGLHRAGLAVPGQVSVIGVDDSLLSRLLVPPLTVVKQDVDQLAQHALALLDAPRTAAGDKNQPIALSVTLVERGSCGPVRGTCPAIGY